MIIYFCIFSRSFENSMSRLSFQDFSIHMGWNWRIYGLYILLKTVLWSAEILVILVQFSWGRWFFDFSRFSRWLQIILRVAFGPSTNYLPVYWFLLSFGLFGIWFVFVLVIIIIHSNLLKKLTTHCSPNSHQTLSTKDDIAYQNAYPHICQKRCVVPIWVGYRTILILSILMLWCVWNAYCIHENLTRNATHFYVWISKFK